MSRFVELVVNGVVVRGVVVLGGVHRRRVCKRYRSGREYCWVEHYVSTYIPRELVELAESHRLVLIAVPPELLEGGSVATQQRSAETTAPARA